MPDFRISNPGGDQWDLDLVDGDLVLMDDTTPAGNAEVVAQRVVYRVMTWLGESPYSPREGVPHLEVLGSIQGAEGIAAIYALVVQDTPGVSEIVEFEYEAPSADNDFTLRVSPTIKAGQVVVPIVLPIQGAA